MLATAPYTPAPETDRLTVLTPRGGAVRHLYHLVRALRELDAADRAYVLEMFKLELLDLPPTT
jgi:hypothetical protein